MSNFHKFKLGQAVELIGASIRLKPLGRFEVVRLMPTEHGLHQYRIRSLVDGHERMVLEAELV
ncbi:MAG TPA: hypothetical protein VGL83_01365 [Stellaceae bacterium]